MDYIKKNYFLISLGFVISLLLLYHHVAVHSGLQLGSSYCNINQVFDCDDVARSQYSELFGIPIASLGLFYYCFFIISLIYIFKKFTEQEKIKSIFVLSFAGLLPSLTMACISLHEMKICINCSLLYLINVLVFGLAVYEIYRQQLGFITSFCDGVKKYFSYFLSFTRQSIVIVVLLIALIGVIAVLPNWVMLPLVYAFNVPDESDIEEIGIESKMIFEKWQNSTPIDLKIDLDNDLTNIDFYYGEQSAEHTIVAWTDFECPFCRIMTQFLMSYIDTYPEKFKMVFKNYPLDSECNSKLQKQVHNDACDFAISARCAGLNGIDKYWAEYEKITKFKYYEPSEQIQKCVKNNKVVRRHILADVEQGIKLDISATPTIYIDGKLITGLNPRNCKTLLGLIGSTE